MSEPRAAGQTETIQWSHLLIFCLGTAIYGWAIVNINIPNNLAEGGMSGITLILRALFQFNPAYSTLILNLPLFALGLRILGRRALIYTIFGTLALSFWLWLWQLYPMHLDLHHDMLISALLAGFFGGLGSGIIYRYGGTTGGSDIIARIVEQRFAIPMGRTLFMLDLLVLIASLVYIDLNQMMYTVIAAFVFSQMVNYTQKGGYSARAFLILSEHSEQISQAILLELERGTTLLQGEGGYTHTPKTLIYVVVDPSEMNTLQAIIHRIDAQAFVTVLDTTQTLGEGFSYAKAKRPTLF
ncbi:YitT family protein [Weissella halotolerans]|uniref:DUF2179 domain-containing protein n=1 Tax=Weissella halotolerans DSM 20190 TaxID=1123500 RepID=A0A0R2FZD5_9LACO|nr:YitT family protein [Weissella halotolerans]KRN33584.1 hypothetical protein IV68_GL000390 [Weissella halotolerans DSM 20190]